MAVFSVWICCAVSAQTEWKKLQLELPDETHRSLLRFESEPAPVNSVLVGFLIPAKGPIEAICPLYAGFDLQGNLSASFAGSWFGKRPSTSIRVAKEGFVVSGMRVLLVTGDSLVRTQQIQVFWKRWPLDMQKSEPELSQVYGVPARDKDTTNVATITLPKESVATGIYGDYQNTSVAQFSFLIQTPPESPSKKPTPKIQGVAAPSPPFQSNVKIPRVEPPVLPQTPR